MTPGSIWFRVAELLGCTIGEARERMAPAELEWWADHWAEFEPYHTFLLTREQTPQEMNSAIKVFFANLGAKHG